MLERSRLTLDRIAHQHTSMGNVRNADAEQIKSRRLKVALLILLLLAAGGAWIILRAPTYQSIDMKSIGSFTLTATSTIKDIPADVRKLDGRRVSISGWMFPEPFRHHVRDFLIVPKPDSDLNIRTITQTVVARMPGGKTTAVIDGELRAEGTLHVWVLNEDGSPGPLFAMDIDRVVPVVPPARLRWPWIAAGGGGALTLLVWLVAHKVRTGTRREQKGLCRRCGYDLRASPGRCPECGTISVKTN
jgi:hypothetical protein